MELIAQFEGTAVYLDGKVIECRMDHSVLKGMSARQANKQLTKMNVAAGEYRHRYCLVTSRHKRQRHDFGDMVVDRWPFTDWKPGTKPDHQGIADYAQSFVGKK